MTRLYVFPDANNRSANKPTEIVEPKKIIGIHNQANPLKKATYLSKRVRRWFVDQAKRVHKWDRVHFSGNKCLLVADIPAR